MGAGVYNSLSPFQLSEGEREITIEIRVNSWGGGSFASNELAGKFEIRLSGKKGSTFDTQYIFIIEVEMPVR